MNELLNKEEESSDKVDMFDDPEVEAEKEEINDNKNSTIVYSGINSNISNISKIDYKKIRSKIDNTGDTDATDDINDNDDKNKNDNEEDKAISTSSTSFFDTSSPIVFEKGIEGK